MKIENVEEGLRMLAQLLDRTADDLVGAREGLDLDLFEAIGTEPWKLRQMALRLGQDAERIKLKYLRLVEKSSDDEA